MPDSGVRRIGDRLVLDFVGEWNRVEAGGKEDSSLQVWTLEGTAVDQLLVYSGVKNGDAINDAVLTGSARAPLRRFRYRTGMQPDAVVALFAAMFGNDGSRFTSRAVEPFAFAGDGGFRFRYELIRRTDGAHLSGVGYGRVEAGVLYALVYQAPRLAFFPRHQGKVEQMARSARLK